MSLSDADTRSVCRGSAKIDAEFYSLFAVLILFNLSCVRAFFGIGRYVDRALAPYAGCKSVRIVLYVLVFGMTLAWYLPKLVEEHQANYKSVATKEYIQCTRETIAASATPWELADALFPWQADVAAAIAYMMMMYVRLLREVSLGLFYIAADLVAAPLRLFLILTAYSVSAHPFLSEWVTPVVTLLKEAIWQWKSTVIGNDTLREWLSADLDQAGGGALRNKMAAYKIVHGTMVLMGFVLFIVCIRTWMRR